MANPTPQVQLAQDASASRFLLEVLQRAAERFPEAFASIDLPPDSESFRKTYADVLVRFEAARVATDARTEIARNLFSESQQRIVWREENRETPLAQALEAPAAALSVETRHLPGDAGWLPEIIYRGKRWSADRFAELGDLLANRYVITRAAADALASMGRLGKVDLSDRRIVALGAGAEMAPTRYLLQAGASVLWLDVAPPPQEWLASERYAGQITWPREDVDLLTQPREVLATIREFAAGEPVDLGLYAYAGGRARELRLAGTMNAIVNALGASGVRSATLLISPSTPMALSQVDRADMDQRRAGRPWWEALLESVGLLGRGAGRRESGSGAASRSIVDIQGTSYQAAQYLEKIMAAECWAAHGPPTGEAARPLRVSANVAAITRTRSLDHPVFAAAFGGAAAFGVETFPPRLSRRVNGLLAIHDWLEETAPVPGRVRVHGGIHTLPYPLAEALMVAAAFGFARSPRLLRGLWAR